MEKRHLLWTLLVLFFCLFNKGELHSQCASNGVPDVGITGGGIMIVGSGEGENLVPLPGDIHFTEYGDCDATLHVVFRVANLVEVEGGLFEFPLDENGNPTPPIALQVSINEESTIFYTHESEYVQCGDNPNFFYWETDINYILANECTQQQSDLYVNINFLDYLGNSYRVEEQNSVGEIFDCSLFLPPCGSGINFCFTATHQSPCNCIIIKGSAATSSKEEDTNLDLVPANRSIQQQLFPNPFSANPELRIEGNPVSGWSLSKNNRYEFLAIRHLL